MVEALVPKWSYPTARPHLLPKDPTACQLLGNSKRNCWTNPPWVKKTMIWWVLKPMTQALWHLPRWRNTKFVKQNITKHRYESQQQVTPATWKYTAHHHLGATMQVVPWPWPETAGCASKTSHPQPPPRWEASHVVFCRSCRMLGWPLELSASPRRYYIKMPQGAARTIRTYVVEIKMQINMEMIRV